MPNDPNAPADIRDMYLIHTMFRREFALAPALVRAVPAGDTERAKVVAAHVQLVDDLLAGHHHAEDKHLWPRLVDRAPDETAPIVHLMEEQHGKIDSLQSALRPATQHWAAAVSEDRREALAAALDSLLPAVTEHMLTEEDQILPLMAKYITAGEWAELTRDAQGQVAAERMPLVFGMLMYEGDNEVIRNAVSQLPPEAASALLASAPQVYADYAERLYGTRNPPRLGARREESAPIGTRVGRDPCTDL
jgi:hemerythrin-like domain-containing protein